MYKNSRFSGRGNSRRGNQNVSGGKNRPFNRGFGQRGRFAPKQIDPRLFVKPAEETTIEVVPVERSFGDFPMEAKLKESLKRLGFVTPTPIQDRTIDKSLSGADLIGLADTGTGKTLAFSLPVINKLLTNPEQNVLIVAPTRELAVQIRDEIRKITEGLGIYSCLLIGGSNIQRQIMDLKRRPHIFIGTPGRLKDLHERNVLRFDRTYTVILDEMDRMLDMGFVKEITNLLSHLPKDRQTLLFSATCDERVEKIAVSFMKNPEKISVKTGATSQNVDQNVIKANGNKMATLKDLVSMEAFEKVLIFGRTKYGVEKLTNELVRSGFRADAIHGDKRQSQRQQALRLFKENRIKILVATDVAARGIDVENITHVINYDQPSTYEDYIHRIGRTGRAGKKGFALTFID